MFSRVKDLRQKWMVSVKGSKMKCCESPEEREIIFSGEGTGEWSVEGMMVGLGSEEWGIFGYTGKSRVTISGQR